MDTRIKKDISYFRKRNDFLLHAFLVAWAAGLPET